MVRKEELQLTVSKRCYDVAHWTGWFERVMQCTVHRMLWFMILCVQAHTGSDGPVFNTEQCVFSHQVLFYVGYVGFAQPTRYEKHGTVPGARYQVALLVWWGARQSSNSFLVTASPATTKAKWWECVEQKQQKRAKAKVMKWHRGLSNSLWIDFWRWYWQNGVLVSW